MMTEPELHRNIALAVPLTGKGKASGRKSGAKILMGVGLGKLVSGATV